MSTQGGCPIFLQHVCRLSAEPQIITAPLKPIIASGFLNCCQVRLVELNGCLIYHINVNTLD